MALYTCRCLPTRLSLLTLFRLALLLLAVLQVTIPLLTITVVRTASFSIYTGVKEEFYSRHWLQRQRLSGTATAGLAGGAASGLLLSVGTSAFEYTKVSSIRGV